MGRFQVVPTISLWTRLSGDCGRQAWHACAALGLPCRAHPLSSLAGLVLWPVGRDACLPTRLTGRHWVEGALQGSDVDLDDRSGRLRGAMDGVGDNPNHFQTIGSRSWATSGHSEGCESGIDERSRSQQRWQGIGRCHDEPA